VNRRRATSWTRWTATRLAQDEAIRDYLGLAGLTVACCAILVALAIIATALGAQ
jgi:hypothetical protein